MASDHFYLFAALASFSADSQQRPARLNGEHWVWVQKGEAWREQFFARERQLDLQAV